MYGDLIREHREKLGINQGELVERLQATGLNVTRAALSHWETGRNPSPLDNLRDALILAQVLKIDLSELAGFIIDEGVSKEYSDAARNAALIVEHLPHEARQMALEQLRAIDKHYSAKS